MPELYELPRKKALRRPVNVTRLPSFVILTAAIAALYFARELFIPLAFAVALSLLLSPPIRGLEKLHVPRAAAAALAILGAVVLAAAIGWVIAHQLVKVASDLPKYRDNIHEKIESIRNPSTKKGSLAQAAENVKEIGKELAAPEGTVANAPSPRLAARSGKPIPVQVVSTPSSAVSSLGSYVGPFLGPFGQLAIVLVFTAFLTVKREDVRNRVLRLAGLSQLNVMTRALDDATHRVSRYLLLQFLVNAAFGILFGTGLALIGVPYAALWGAVAALFRIVPYVGTITAGLLPFLLSLAVFDEWTQPAMVLGLFGSIELTLANFIEPMLYGSQTGISALAILVAAVFWTLLWGPVGLILSTPLTVCAVVLGRYLPQLSFLYILLGDDEVLDAEAQIYQRLLAMDPMEARTVVNRYLKDHSVLDLYDSVLIPALTLAEQDRHQGALDSARGDFLFVNFGEIVAECATRVRASVEEPSFVGRVLCIPASDTADEITASMLAQLLEESGFAVVSFPVGPLNTTLAALDPGESDAICICALPPFALGKARSLCRQVRTRFPNARVIVGVWGSSRDVEEIAAGFDRTPPDKVTTTLAETITFLSGQVESGQLEEEPV